MHRFTMFQMIAFAAPAHAASMAVPEPSTAGLLALGVLGVVVGRLGSRARRD